jgi:transposase InsO family protein
MALTNQDPLAELLHHSGLGSQYAATRDQLLLTTHGITINMSKRGSYCDNACVESFCETLKREFVYHLHYATR